MPSSKVFDFSWGLCGRSNDIPLEPEVAQKRLQRMESSYTPVVQLKSISTRGAGSDAPFAGAKVTVSGRSNVHADYQIDCPF